MRKLTIAFFLLCASLSQAQDIPFGKGKLRIQLMTENAVRIQYMETEASNPIGELIYVKQPMQRIGKQTFKTKQMKLTVDAAKQTVNIQNNQGKTVFSATSHRLQPQAVAGLPTYEATLRFHSPQDECLYGLGQFQDGYSNIRGLSRRLTQVNTQISVPMLLSSKGYGILWNNYGLTDYNPAEQSIKLERRSGSSTKEVVNVTSTEGGKQEVRERNIYEATLNITEEGDYALLLDVGQQMARRHNLCIDGKTVIEMQNLWLPPTASAICHLTAGQHAVSAELTRDDKPLLYYKKVTDETTFRSPVSNAVDYTVFVGTADEVIGSYRQLTGTVPMLPRWAVGYIHCRERFHSQEEILQTANRFSAENLPVSVLVQDWQYWGKYGWNAMQFDESNYPNPRALTDSLHNMGIRLMVSVWSKIDKNSTVGKQMLADGHYIPNTDWIDFFSPQAAAAYWKNFSERLLPLGIDAWWQDATEPENDDLVGRRVNNGQWPGEWVRNVYPLMVNKTVYEGLCKDLPDKRPFILTRCGFPGIQRYGSALWSGDVGNDWETLRRQITAGLGMQAAGIPWWTYDAGGFFRPGNQYNDEAYIQRMLRWIQVSVYLPLMRVHGYMSDTEPWRYGQQAQSVIAQCLAERYRLMPYIYSQVAAVSRQGSTLMRPLVFDFADDAEALQQKYEYMFGSALLINPVTQPDVTEWKTYLPRHKAGWYDYRTGKHYDGGQYVTTPVTNAYIPVFVKAGSIIPMDSGKAESSPEIHVYPGADATFSLYEDDGVTRDYERGVFTLTEYSWNDKRQELKSESQITKSELRNPKDRKTVKPQNRKTVNLIIHSCEN